jgi:hypothetical protein
MNAWLCRGGNKDGEGRSKEWKKGWKSVSKEAICRLLRRYSRTVLEELAGIKDDEICTRLKFGILVTTNVSWQSGRQ